MKQKNSALYICIDIGMYHTQPLNKECRTLSRFSSVLSSMLWMKKKTQDFQRGRKVVGNPGIVNPQNKYIRNTQWQTSAHVIYKHKYVLNINRNLFFSACRFYLLASTFRTLKHKSNQRINKQLNERALMVGVVLKAKRYGWYRHLYYCNLCWSPFWRCYPTWWLDECSFEEPNVHNGTEYVTQLCFHLTGNLWFALTWKTWHSIHL